MYILHLIRVWHMNFSECPDLSLCHSTSLARPASSWIDDYFDWTTLESCCSKPPVFPGNLLINHTLHNSSVTDFLVLFSLFTRYLHRHTSGH
jgi:predicted acylesterase/phospholipase RssA